MNYREAFTIVDLGQTRDYKVTILGKVVKKRLFVSGETLCEYKKGCRRFGYAVPESEVYQWSNLEPYKVDDLVKIRNFMKKVVKYLNESGMWANIREDYEIILAQGDVFLIDLINSDWTNKRDKLHKLAVSLGRDKLSFHCDSIVDTARKGIKCVNYDTYAKGVFKPILKDAIANRTRTQHKWYKGYDNSIEVAMHDNIFCGWYSEEYKGCGNGHYYLLLDDKHAMFCEND